MLRQRCTGSFLHSEGGSLINYSTALPEDVLGDWKCILMPKQTHGLARYTKSAKTTLTFPDDVRLRWVKEPRHSENCFFLPKSASSIIARVICSSYKHVILLPPSLACSLARSLLLLLSLLSSFSPSFAWTSCSCLFCSIRTRPRTMGVVLSGRFAGLLIKSQVAEDDGWDSFFHAWINELNV